MSAEKRPADDDPSSRMLVKRQNVSSSDGALARLNASSNALVQTVSVKPPRHVAGLTIVGAAHQRSAVPSDGADGPLWRDFRGQVRPNRQSDRVGIYGQEHMYGRIPSRSGVD